VPESQADSSASEPGNQYNRPTMPPSPVTHRAVDPRWIGEPLDLGEGTARAALLTLPEMAVDGRGLVHGGFVFGLADYAAMLAVNDSNVVLGGAEVRFLKPVSVGDRLVAEAHVIEVKGRRQRVDVVVSRDGDAVMAGELVCVVLDRHVLDRR
jgi:uncharacterized protein (TIGR00369 family)